jgi:hypothetical protein
MWGNKAINYFYFGDRGEVFEYRFIGIHTTKSGYTCIADPNSFSLPQLTSTKLPHHNNSNYNNSSKLHQLDNEHFWYEELEKKIKEIRQQEEEQKGKASSYAVKPAPFGFLFLGLLEQSYGLDGVRIYGLRKTTNDNQDDQVTTGLTGMMLQSFYESGEDD